MALPVITLLMAVPGCEQQIIVAGLVSANQRVPTIFRTTRVVSKLAAVVAAPFSCCSGTAFSHNCDRVETASVLDNGGRVWNQSTFLDCPFTNFRRLPASQPRHRCMRKLQQSSGKRRLLQQQLVMMILFIFHSSKFELMPVNQNRTPP